MGVLTILLILLVVAAIYVVSVYNGLQTLKTQIEASIQEIGNQLKRQASLIPNLESAVKGYLKHERGIFELLTDARKAAAKAQETGKLKDIDEAIANMRSLIPQVNILVESNPQLKADGTVIKFMNELTDTADKLAYARRSVIDLSQSYNQKLVTFPSNLIANMFGFEKEQGLATPRTGDHVTVSADDMKEPKVDLN